MSTDTYCMIIALPCYQRQIETLQRKNKYIPISLLNIPVKILNKILAKWIKQHGSHIRTKCIFPLGMQVWFSAWKPINVIHHINWMKDKIHISISSDEKESTWQSSIPFHDKNFWQIKNMRKFNITKAI